MRFDQLRSSRLVLVDVEIKELRIEAGWVYAEPGLRPIETVRSPDNGQEFLICIPEVVRSIQHRQTYSFPEEPVEFLRP